MNIVSNLAVSLSECAPRRVFIKRLSLLAAFVTVGRFIGTSVANGTKKFLFKTIECVGQCTGVDTNCGNGGFKPESYLKKDAPKDKCCNCKLQANGCPPGTSPGGAWDACCCCGCNDVYNVGVKGKVYRFQDCCASESGAGGAGCPADVCFNPAPVEGDANGWVAWGQTANCNTSSEKSWCNGHKGGPEYGTLSGTATGSCCEITGATA